MLFSMLRRRSPFAEGVYRPRVDGSRLDVISYQSWHGIPYHESITSSCRMQNQVTTEAMLNHDVGSESQSEIWIIWIYLTFEFEASLEMDPDAAGGVSLNGVANQHLIIYRASRHASIEAFCRVQSAGRAVIRCSVRARAN